MPIREYECERGHKTEKIMAHGSEVPEYVPCEECIRLDRDRPALFISDKPVDSSARLIRFSKTFAPTDDFRRREARDRYKEGAS